MFTIGDFARHGRVSVRMLRHYDAVGLLQPARVDDATGYRYYEARQLSRLNRIIALKDLGFTLQQVQTILDARLDVEQLRGMLTLRRTELRARIEADEARLNRVEARLRTIESEGHMSTSDVVVKRIPPVRVAEVTAVAASFEPDDIGPVIQPLYPALLERLAAAGIPVTGPAVAVYEDADGDDGRVVVRATIPVAADPGERDGFAVVDLPEVATAATIVHHGSMDGIAPTEQALVRWIEENGYQPSGYVRELYVECPPDDLDRWVTELQQPLAAP